MNRNLFLKTTFLCGLGIVVFPQPMYRDSFESYQEFFTRDQLIGKGILNFKGSKFKMQQDAHKSFFKMKSEAAKENINIEIVSAFRSFERQKQIFENKYNQFISEGITHIDTINKIIEYTSIPGTSRHHWGTDIDIIDANYTRPESILEEEHFYGNGPYCKLREWMNENANLFGFYEVYTDIPTRKGFKYEPWHYSYAPVSISMIRAFKKLNLKKIFQEENILGNEYFTEVIINKYRTENILDINPELL